MRLSTLWRRLSPHVRSWAGLAPFLVFALFPFYWGLITSLKADANLYDIRSNPFWFSDVDRKTGQPYHKDIIVPASLTDGRIRWTIAVGAHTTRSDSERHPAAIAFIGDQEVVSPVDGRLWRIQLPRARSRTPTMSSGSSAFPTRPSRTTGF